MTNCSDPPKRATAPPVTPRYPPYNRSEQQQVQEQNKWPIPAQVSVDEGESELNEQRRNQHEGDGKAHPDHVVGFVVHPAQRRGSDQLRNVQNRSQNNTERRPDTSVTDH